MPGAHAELLGELGLLDPMETSVEDLEALERNPRKPVKKKKATKRSRDRTTKKRAGKPRDELGRFTRSRKK